MVCVCAAHARVARVLRRLNHKIPYIVKYKRTFNPGAYRSQVKGFDNYHIESPRLPATP